MIYYENLNNKIFDSNKHADEFLVLSGFISTLPIKEVEKLPYETTVIYGMYEQEGISNRLHTSLVKINAESPNVRINYASEAIHSKCYLWRQHGNIIDAVTGSANFTSKGLYSYKREILTDIEPADYDDLNNYINNILADSKNCSEIGSEDLKIRNYVKTAYTVKDKEIKVFPQVCKASLLSRKKPNYVNEGGDLNWGFSPKGHTKKGDAYITIDSNMIRNFPELFPPKKMYASDLDKGGKSFRQNDCIELIWDDGTSMLGLLEGSKTDKNGLTYPNKLSSFPSKNIIGLYIRERLGVAPDHIITYEDLISYGRTDITISLIGDGVYSMDFSRPTE